MIRPARDDDAADLVALVGACWAEYPGCVTDVAGESPEFLQLASYCASRGGAAWVEDAEGRAVGVACTWPFADGAWEMAKIYLAPAQRGGGTAHALLDTAENHARTHGATHAQLWSDTRFDRAHRFYEKRGYVRAGPLRALDDRSHSIEFGYAKPLIGVVVEKLDAAAAASAELALARLLVACVEAGAFVGFVSPLAIEDARAHWRKVASAVARGEKILLVAWCDGTLAGTVQLELATQANQPHRGEVMKMLVHPGLRLRGIGRALLERIETEAQAAGRWLLTLDVRAGQDAERLYRAGDWRECGRIRQNTLNTDGTPADAVLYSKRLGADSQAAELAPAGLPSNVVVQTLDAAAAVAAEEALARLLVTCVEDGAAISFLPPLPMETAQAFWRKVADAVARGEKILVVAWCDGALVGTVQLDLATPPNQPHRADVAKMMVRPDLRRRGIGRALLDRIEAEGAAAGRWLLTLDTRGGDAGQQLYAGAGWIECGRIPDYALSADRTPHDTVLYWKRVIPPAPPAAQETRETA